MNEEKNSAGEDMTRRFHLLNVWVTIILLAAIFISIFQFGGEYWHGQKQVALVIHGERNNPGWNKVQYLALKSVCDELDYDLILRENVPLDYDSSKAVVDELFKRGVNVISFSNGLHLYDLRDFEREYPKISFCTIESVSALWGSGSYSILSYEGSYIAGILAGLHTKTNKIGYVAPFSDAEVNQGINAFTLGVQRVNPNAEVLLNWTGGWHNPSSEEQAVQNLKAHSVDVLTYHQNGDTVPNTAERAGISFISVHESYPQHNYFLAAIKIDWKKVYLDLMRYTKTYEVNTHTAFGIAQQVVDFEVSDKISTREKVFIDEAKWELQNGRIIFMGDIFDRHDVRRCSANEAISFQSLQSQMDWLIKGVRVVGT